MQTNLKAYASVAFLAAALIPILSGGDASAAPGQTASLAAPPTCGATPTSGTFAGTTGGIGSSVTPGVFTSTINVVGLDPYLWDVNLFTTITHTDNSDLDITLTSPAGTVVTIVTDSSTFDNVFNGTQWDDNVNDPVTEATFTNLVAKTPLAPEGRLEAFRGENPNGTWTLTVMDDAVGDVGNAAGWSLDISTLAAAPVSTPSSFTLSPNAGIRNNGTIVSNQVVSGLGTYLEKVTVYLEIPHTDSSELRMSLQNPGGTPVKLNTDNGGTNDNVFNGTLFDSDAPTPVTDAVYANLVPEALVSSEGPPDVWLGTDPNGIWSLIVTDDATGTDVGTLQRWDLNLRTILPPIPSAPTNFPGTGGAVPDATVGIDTGTFVFTANVSGLPTALWDVDLATEILHTASDELDITLTSPAGTIVTITTDNGGLNDDVFNGTTWDDNANDPVTDHTYTNLVAAPLLSPEGRLAAFRGQNPNGTWTLTVTDDATGDIGEVVSWGVTIAALTSAPAETLTVVTQSPSAPIADLSTVADVMAVAGFTTGLTEVELYVEILHTQNDELDITLTSPAGTIVTVTTDNGGLNDNVFNGTLYDPSLTATVTDSTYANNAVETPISPEGSFDNFLGQNPNGNWTLTITDDASGDTGTLVRWDLRLRTCVAPPVPYCFGDGTGTPCPCSNNGAAGNGCANNINVNGANLAFSGVSKVSGDTLTLLGTGMTNSYVLYFQGTGQVGGGLGTTFGDGLRCANGVQVRLGTHLNVLGASMHPNGNPPISVAGGVAPGDTRYYQGWYRDANPVFCPFPLGDTFNLTNGLTVFWAP